VKLVACPDCHTQFDVSEMAAESHFDCRCGRRLDAKPPVSTDALARRCSGCGAIAQNDAETCDYCGSGIVQVPDRGSLICPECYARNLDDARYCLGCGVAFDPQSPVSQMSELRCPCCACWMASREVGGIEIQECGKCFGLWAPEDRFDQLVDRAVAAARERGPDEPVQAPRVDGGNPAQQSVEYRRCPECDALMVRRNFRKRSGVIVDRCHQHGTWLDAHELERIAGFVLSGRHERAAALEARVKAESEKQEARMAMLRAQGVVRESHTEYTLFGEKKNTSTVGTILDLLVGILH
jgi:Zn-finger nucleic acid-binding protein